MIRQLAPGMVQQMQSVCADCNGEGEVINEKDRCKKCEGKKVIKEVKILEVHVDKGMKHGQRITFTGEADQAPGVEPGDIVLLLQEKEHEVISFVFASFLFYSAVCLVCKIQVRSVWVPWSDNKRATKLLSGQAELMRAGPVLYATARVVRSAGGVAFGPRWPLTSAVTLRSPVVSAPQFPRV